ncbi:MAG TPA: YraN family protein [Acidimicrobiia bacterium]|nr:YraN family protein [Acidimicrobiia bacterium]
MAEDLAVEFLTRHRVRVVARNVIVGRGEIDVLALIDGLRSVVEIRSLRQGREWTDPISAFDVAKSRQVRGLASQVGAGRVDLVTVSFSPGGVDLHWLPWAG